MDSAHPKAGWRSRVKIVNDKWRRKVQFATPQAEKAITGTVDKLRNLMSQPMIVDGETQRDDTGEPISRRRFWQYAHGEDALPLIEPDVIEELETLEQLADVVYIARYEQDILNQIVENRAFLTLVSKIRDKDGNSLLHWAAAADIPNRVFFKLITGLRHLGEDPDTSATIVSQVEDTLKAENNHAVKLHEIAYALKDEGLAAELMRCKVSVREKNKAGTDFVTDTLRAEGGEEYLQKLGSIAEEQKLDEQVIEELKISETDLTRSRILTLADKLIANLINGDQRMFKEYLEMADKGELEATRLFLENSPEADARNRGIFHFGRLDRDGNDWLFHVVEHCDLEVVDSCLKLIQRHVRDIVDIFVRARPQLNQDDLTLQLMRVYLKTSNAKGQNLLQKTILTKKAILLHRLLDIALYKPSQINAVRDASRRQEMLAKNMSLMVGKRISENLFLATALAETPGQCENEDVATTNVARMMSVLFDLVDKSQGYSLFNMTYRLGRPPNTRDVSFYNYIMRNDKILSGVKELFSIYSENFLTPA